MERYKALARKYRPMTFDEIVGQDFVVKTLKNAIEMGRISHAYLFTGPRGIGKTTAARVFAKAINCLKPVGVNPCNKCSNCLEINNGTSVDVIEIDGASNRKVEEAREIRENVRILPVNNRYKVYIIDEVHMLTDEAFNALLKTLEEPPDYVVFILATTDAHKIPMTILSRCQKYDFKKISNSYMSEYLASVMEKEDIKCDRDSLNMIIRNSDGCMRDALSLIDQLAAFTGGDITSESAKDMLDLSEQEIANDIFEAIVKNDSEKIFYLIDEFSRKGVDYHFAMEVFIHHTRNLLHAFTGGFSDKTLTSKEIEFYNSLKPFLTLKKIFVFFQIFQKVLSDMRYLAIEKYVFEFGVFKAANVDNIIPIELVSSNSRVESREVSIISDNIAANSYNPSKAQAPEGLTDKQKTWKGFIKYLEPINASIAAQAAYGVIKEIGDKIVLSFQEKDKFYYNMLLKPDRNQFLKEHLNKYFGKEMSFSITIDNNSQDSSFIKTESEIKSFQEEMLRETAKGNSVVNKILTAFDGEIEKVDKN